MACCGTTQTWKFIIINRDVLTGYDLWALSTLILQRRALAFHRGRLALVTRSSRSLTTASTRSTLETKYSASSMEIIIIYATCSSHTSTNGCASAGQDDNKQDKQNKTKQDVHVVVNVDVKYSKIRVQIPEIIQIYLQQTRRQQLWLASTGWRRRRLW